MKWNETENSDNIDPRNFQVFIFVFEDLFQKKLSCHWKADELNIQKTSYQMPSEYALSIGLCP